WSITFAIVLFNLGLVCGTGPEPTADGEPPPPRKLFWPARLGWELLAPMVLFIGAVLLASILMNNSRRAVNRLLRVGVVQPATPADLKWNDTQREDIWNTLWSLSQKFVYRSRNQNNVDLVLWPEAAPPFPVQGAQWRDEHEMMNKLAVTLGRPVLFGAVGEVAPSPGQIDSSGYIDGVFLVEPNEGFAREVYAKRHLVPFGEYNPLPKWLPFSDSKVVQMMGDTVPGTKAVTIPVNYSNGQVVRAGPLVCYEDIFAGLARDETKAGADLLVVVTNDAWFGHGGGSLQHAAHSVLRAIETRRPVVRCGNDGWSGFIDQDGNAFEVEKIGNTIMSEWVLKARGTTYFRGTGAFVVYTNPQFDGTETFYTRHGDWFVGLAALLVLGGMITLRKTPRTPAIIA
ncbi:MAG TPA: apolipoprotein N-acyltransferase, partial [Verrucomicrobiae bacterium]|nr:apolipoprotein N-acyltransferase [Verrucomicrobiae bacterium]